MRLTLNPAVAVLVANGLVNWTTITAEIPCDCLGHLKDGGPIAVIGGHAPWCAAGRNPLLGVAGRPCPTCNGDGHSMNLRCERCGASASLPLEMTCDDHDARPMPCPSCLGSGGRTVEIWTDERPPDYGALGEWTVRPVGDGSYELIAPDYRNDLPVPLGVQVGTCTLATALPIVGNCQPLPEGHTLGVLHLRNPDGLWIIEQGKPNIDISSQLPFGDWSAGQWAVKVTNPKATAPQ